VIRGDGSQAVPEDMDTVPRTDDNRHVTHGSVRPSLVVQPASRLLDRRARRWR
jgi:hypothetical protein